MSWEEDAPILFVDGGARWQPDEIEDVDQALAKLVAATNNGNGIHVYESDRIQQLYDESE